MYLMVSYKRISKPIARKMYNHGITIFLLPCKVRDDAVEGNNPWIVPTKISLFIGEQEENKFDSLVNIFEYYNCNAELGYYTHFFVAEEDVASYEMCKLICD